MRKEWIDEEKPKLFGDREVSRNIPDIRDLPPRLSSDQIGAATTEPKESTGPRAVDAELFIPDLKRSIGPDEDL